jgi:hypothetical protein
MRDEQRLVRGIASVDSALIIAALGVCSLIPALELASCS